ncbi:hypothetical protein SMACR_09562 [Sordaria macrospora]|uniref:WGS project CABT00000000 data, contig 2.124 n=2 Tax=Sordaria macrospora TaxID=5147 RepID=F7WCE0_SORMK|nr:uncharacterized protein SMAC_09562 [Sordaria macrospora k-hell]KAA8623970.1 hypothetical protein SMACR_09562 [Sordaria macrospora]KAH7628902.1 hypothetical protein B0T09DRAFT_267314 [Sordaria sp. MPI-SDFR-AT-0083]WPJ57207.1 hypothetical protein SMAC4_09562 [Sordaria macrospora]CCC05601.1 unnamed protein product [Sordaria macrospora k-hell]
MQWKPHSMLPPIMVLYLTVVVTFRGLLPAASALALPPKIVHNQKVIQAISHNIHGSTAPAIKHVVATANVSPSTSTTSAPSTDCIKIKSKSKLEQTKSILKYLKAAFHDAIQAAENFHETIVKSIIASATHVHLEPRSHTPFPLPVHVQVKVIKPPALHAGPYTLHSNSQLNTNTTPHSRLQQLNLSKDHEEDGNVHHLRQDVNEVS